MPSPLKSDDMKLPAILFWSMFAVAAVSSLARAAEPTPPATQSDAKATTQPAKTLTLDLGNKVTMKLALIPAGKFMMGSQEPEQLDAAKAATAVGVREEDARNWFANESPQHE